LSYLLAFCRLSIGFLFLYSFLAKVRDIDRFAQTIAHFKLVPLWWSRPLALLFLSGEAAVVILMIMGGSLLPLGFGLTLLLLLAFTVALMSVLARRIPTTCNCFGSDRKPVTHAEVWRNAGLLLLSTIGLWAAGTVSEATITLNGVERFLIVVVAAVFVLLWTNLREIVTLFWAA
jgi:hypothetical protein